MLLQQTSCSKLSVRNRRKAGGKISVGMRRTADLVHAQKPPVAGKKAEGRSSGHAGAIFTRASLSVGGVRVKAITPPASPAMPASSKALSEAGVPLGRRKQVFCPGIPSLWQSGRRCQCCFWLFVWGKDRNNISLVGVVGFPCLGATAYALLAVLPNVQRGGELADRNLCMHPTWQ